MTIDEMRELLGIWRLGVDGRALPEPDEWVRLRLGGLRPDEDSSALFGELRRLGWIEVLTNGDWTLTDLGVKARPAESGEATVVQESAAEKEAAWRRFRMLCGYYADCVQLQEKEVEYLFDNQHNTKFYLPPLPIGWVDEEKKFKLSASTAQNVAFRFVANGAGEDLQAFIGYPLSAFRTSAECRAYAPLLLFPVDIIRDAAGTWAKIQQESIDINQKWLRYHLPPDEQQTVLKSLTFANGERRGMVDPEAAIAYFTNRFRVKLDPDRLVFNIWEGDGLLNAAALFLENGLKYARSLRKELGRIRQASAEVLDRTALAYVFRDPPLPNRNEGREDVAFDFNAANSEQHEAVDEALNHPANKVTGPPGTGKSQVAVNLIANLLIRGRSVLFTSKNHKAIHAIHDKVDALGKDLPLVQFCSQSDGGKGAAWFSQDLDAQIGRLLRARDELHGAGEGATVTLEDAADRWRDLKPKIRAIEALREGVSAAEGKRDAYAKGLERDGAKPDERLVRDIDASRRAWERASTAQITWWRRLFRMFSKRTAGVATLDVRARLKKVLPRLGDEFTSEETLKKRLERVSENLAGYFREEARLRELATQVTKLPPYENGYGCRRK